MTVPISEFESFIMPYAADAPSEMLQHVVREAVVRFMRRTRIAVESVEIDLQCGVREYLVETPECEKIVAIERVLDACAWNSVRADWPSGDLPRPYSWRRDHHHPVVELQYSPKEDDVVRVDYSWTIGRDGCEIPDFIYEEWEEAIKHGALAELLMMPGQEWTRPQMAQYHEGKYNQLVVEAKSRKWHNHTQGAITMNAPSFMAPPIRRRR